MTTLSTIRTWTLALLCLALITPLTAAGSLAAQEADDASDAVTRLCTTERPGLEPVVDSDCATAVRAATVEAAGWPDYDSIAISERGHQVELARIEASGWPDYDPIAISEKGLQIEIARREAAEEAAAWPDYDPTALAGRSADTQANSTDAALGHQT